MGLNDAIGENIDFILDELGLDYDYKNGKYRLACPIHLGQNKNCTIYVTDRFAPNWKCWSYNCHESNQSLTKFLMLYLNKTYDQLKQWLDDINIKYSEKREDKNFQITTSILNQTRSIPQYKISISEIEKYRKHPEFYLQRGFQKSTLDKYGVKYCQERKNTFFKHIIIPVFNDDYQSIAGIVARNPNKKCVICEGYHEENESCLKSGPKWKGTYGFCNNAFLYNYWNAKEEIEKTNEVILVEGPPDTWRFYEAGILNVLSLFGTSLSYEQFLILESLPLIKIKIFFDPDEPGINSANNLKDKLERFFTVDLIHYHKQPADCSAQELENICGNKILTKL